MAGAGDIRDLAGRAHCQQTPADANGNKIIWTRSFNEVAS